MDTLPIGIILLATIIAVLIAIRCGYWLGRAARRHGDGEKLPPVSTIVGAALGLLSFILAFTFGIASGRYDSRKALVRNEANAIGTTWLRADFLPEPDRSRARTLLRAYVDNRLVPVQSRDLGAMKKALAESDRIEDLLWDIAVMNGRRDMNSPVVALYIASMNEVIDLHALRVTLGLQSRIPRGIWIVLYSLILLGMMGVGYMTAMADSTPRSWAPPILAISYSLVIMLILSLDRPLSGFITVSQQPLVNVRASMDSTSEAGPRPESKP